MKIKVQKRTDSAHIIIKFGDDVSEFWLSEFERMKLLQQYNHAVADGELTLRVINYDIIFVWVMARLVFMERMNVSQFFTAIGKIKPGIWVTMETESFKITRKEVEPVKSWVEIGKWVMQSDRNALINIKNARKLGIAHLLKPILSRYVERAFIYRDWNSKFSFGFNGKHELLDPKKRTGLIGAIICHGINENPFSVELCPKEGISYSIHT